MGDLFQPLAEYEMIELLAEVESNRNVVLPTEDRALPGNHRRHSYLDFLQILSKQFDFSSFVLASTDERITFRPNFWYKSFPKKFFHAFATKSHSYFLANCCLYDVYILFQPTGEDCNCRTDHKTHVSKAVAEMVTTEIVRKLFEWYYHPDKGCLQMFAKVEIW